MRIRVPLLGAVFTLGLLTIAAGAVGDGHLGVVHVDLNTILNAVTIAGVGAVFSGVRSALTQLRKLNGRLVHIEEWRLAQENMCADRAENCRALREASEKLFHTVQSEVRDMRNQRGE